MTGIARIVLAPLPFDGALGSARTGVLIVLATEKGLCVGSGLSGRRSDNPHGRLPTRRTSAEDVGAAKAPTIWRSYRGGKMLISLQPREFGEKKAEPIC